MVVVPARVYNNKERNKNLLLATFWMHGVLFSVIMSHESHDSWACVHLDRILGKAKHVLQSLLLKHNARILRSESVENGQNLIGPLLRKSLHLADSLVL
jgi:hypothetical protein